MPTHQPNRREVNALDARATAREPDPSNPNTTLDPFVRRWSSRSMTGTSVAAEQLQHLLEAARWAPSCFNQQPWHFLYSHRDGQHWSKFIDPLIEFNQSWAVQAGAMLVLLSRSQDEAKEQAAPTHQFDAGAAWMSLALAASDMGLVAHAMWGFDQAQARAKLAIPEVYAINAFIAVGHPAAAERLPAGLAEREQPSTRKSLSQISTEGPFKP